MPYGASDLPKGSLFTEDSREALTETLKTSMEDFYFATSETRKTAKTDIECAYLSDLGVLAGKDLMCNSAIFESDTGYLSLTITWVMDDPYILTEDYLRILYSVQRAKISAPQEEPRQSEQEYGERI